MWCYNRFSYYIKKNVTENRTEEMEENYMATTGNGHEPKDEIQGCPLCKRKSPE